MYRAIETRPNRTEVMCIKTPGSIDVGDNTFLCSGIFVAPSNTLPAPDTMLVVLVSEDPVFKAPVLFLQSIFVGSSARNAEVISQIVGKNRMLRKPLEGEITRAIVLEDEPILAAESDIDKVYNKAGKKRGGQLLVSTDMIPFYVVRRSQLEVRVDIPVPLDFPNGSRQVYTHINEQYYVYLKMAVTHDVQ